MSATGPLQRLIDKLKALPGVGPRSAERIAFHLLKTDAAAALELAQAVRDIKEKVQPCRRCFNLAEGEFCAICLDPRRDASVIYVVEQPKDLLSLENTGLVMGHYHVLMGHLSPVDGIRPGDLTIESLVERVRAGGITEVVIATNPNYEGDTTAVHISGLLTPLGVKVTRLACGIAPGAQIEYANRSMLEAALRGRQPA